MTPEIWMTFAVLAGTLYGSYLAATRWLTAFYPPPFLLGSQLLIGAVLLLPAGLASIPASTDLRVWVLVIVSSLASAFGNYLLVVVNRTTPATVSAPLIYFQLIAATVIGFFVFGDWPEPLALSRRKDTVIRPGQDVSMLRARISGEGYCAVPRNSRDDS